MLENWRWPKHTAACPIDREEVALPSNWIWP